METKEIFTEGEAVTVCRTVTGFGVSGVCTEGVKTCAKEDTEVANDNSGEEVDNPRKVLDDSWSTAIGVVEGDGLMGGMEGRDDGCGGAGLLTTCDVLVFCSTGLLVDD